jgi:phosphate-selective porin
MMKRSIQYICCCILLVTIFAACSKGGAAPADDNGGGPHVITPTDVTAPVVEIATPAADQVFMSGNTINITGRLTDDYGLYQGSIKITNDATGAVLKEQAYEIHGLKLYDYSIAYVTSVTVAADYIITVSFEDHGLNRTTKSVKVKVTP